MIPIVLPTHGYLAWLVKLGINMVGWCWYAELPATVGTERPGSACTWWADLYIQSVLGWLCTEKARVIRWYQLAGRVASCWWYNQLVNHNSPGLYSAVPRQNTTRFTRQTWTARPQKWLALSWSNDIAGHSLT